MKHLQNLPEINSLLKNHEIIGVGSPSVLQSNIISSPSL